jgi:hypothetical protein
METVNKFYRESTSKIIEYCNVVIGGFTTDDLCKLFSSLYMCIEVGKDEELIKFAEYCFGNKNLRKIKAFLKFWNNDILIRPLQLLGLLDSEIKEIHIPLHKAYEIIKKNPYRLPQISLQTALKIISSHLRLEISPPGNIVNHETLEYKSSVALFCGEICRTVYENLNKRKWTSTPISKILEQFPEYTELKDFICKFYFCKEKDQ